MNSQSTSIQLPDPETGILFEDMVKQLPENFNYDAFPNVRYFIGTLLLQSELKADRLMLEVQKLSNEIAAKLTRNKEEKKLVALLADHRLLQKLFALELTPGDYDSIVSRKNGLKPSALVNQLSGTEYGVRSKAKALGGTPYAFRRTKAVEFSHINELNELYEAALRFYAGVKERDVLMMQRVDERLKETGATKVAVITGGFHSEPFHQYFTSKKYTYALISPSITGADAQGHEAYINNVLQSAQRTTGNAQGKGSRGSSLGVERSTLSAKEATYESVSLADRQVLASENPYGIDQVALRTMVRDVIHSVTSQMISGPVQEIGDGSAVISFTEAQDIVKARKAKARAQGSRGAWPSLSALFRDSSLKLSPVIAGSRLAENYFARGRSEVRDQGDLEPGTDEESADVLEEAGTSLDDLLGELHAVADEDESDSGDARAEALQHIALIESAKHKNHLLPAIVDAQKFLRSPLAGSRSEARLVAESLAWIQVWAPVVAGAVILGAGLAAGIVWGVRKHSRRPVAGGTAKTEAELTNLFERVLAYYAKKIGEGRIDVEFQNASGNKVSVGEPAKVSKGGILDGRQAVEHLQWFLRNFAQKNAEGNAASQVLKFPFSEWHFGLRVEGAFRGGDDGAQFLNVDPRRVR
ncbi:MAG: hypothetical protein WCJ71_11160, partial [Candidatus Omnitrophota bacterium]